MEWVTELLARPPDRRSGASRGTAASGPLANAAGAILRGGSPHLSEENPMLSKTHQTATAVAAEQDLRSARAEGAAAQQSKPDHVRALFHVTADAEAGTLPRLIEPFAKMGLTPTRLHASREDGDGTVQTVDMRLAAVPQQTAHLVEKMLRAVVGVQQVIVVTEAAAR